MTSTATQNRIAWTTNIEIETDGPRGFVERTARMENIPEPITFGVSPHWREHYGVTDDEFPIRPTTNDVFVAALTSCMLGVFAGALETRGIKVERGDLTSEVKCEMGPMDGKQEWAIRTIHVHYKLSVPEELRDKARRVHGFYEAGCPLSQTLKGGPCVITSELEFV